MKWLHLHTNQVSPLKKPNQSIKWNSRISQIVCTTRYTYPTLSEYTTRSTSSQRRMRQPTGREGTDPPPGARNSWPWCHTGRTRSPPCSPPMGKQRTEYRSENKHKSLSNSNIFSNFVQKISNINQIILIVSGPLPHPLLFQ